jgi:hypothetical protein
MKQKEIPFPSDDTFLISMLQLTSPAVNPSWTEEDFKTLLTQANLHGIIPQLHKALSNSHATPVDIKQSLQKQYTRIVQANLLLTAHLLTVTKALKEEQFNYLAIKGPTLSQELYSDISMRQFSDIDLFVDEKDIIKISELLIKLDYSPVLPLSLLRRKKFLALDNDFSFRHNRSNALLELHWKLFPLRHKMPLDFTQLHSASKTLALQQKEIQTLSTEHNLLYLSLHGAKHIFERYEWVYDLHILIENNPGLDLESIYLQAKKENLDTPLLLGIFLSHKLFETTLPDKFHTYKTESIQKLIDKIMNYYKEGFVFWDESDKKRARFLFLSELFQEQEQQNLWLLKSLFKTTPVDVITFNLPDNLVFLYPVLRPFRLFYKHLFTKKPVYA